MNNWNIPNWLEKEVRNRDKNCIYCHIEFNSSKKTKKSVATWEYIVNDAKIINRENIARCCFSCNSSKGTKKLSDWFESDYCKKRGITKNTIAEVARKALAKESNIARNDFYLPGMVFTGRKRYYRSDNDFHEAYNDLYLPLMIFTGPAMIFTDTIMIFSRPGTIFTGPLIIITGP